MRKSQRLIFGVLLFAAGIFAGTSLSFTDSLREAMQPPPLPSPSEGARGASSAQANPEDTDAAKQKLDEAFRTLLERHLSNGMTPSALAEGAIRGMVESFKDPYTRYMAPSDAALHAQGTAGEYFEIGAGVRKNGEEFVIASVNVGGPAEAAGIRDGDVILSVDGVALAGKTQSDVEAMVRGAAAGKVLLSLHRTGVPEPLAVTVAREKRVITTVTAEPLLAGKLRVVRIAVTEFNENTDEQFGRVMEDVRDTGAQGIVLDLRNNSGGLVQQAKDIACRFVRSGLVITRELRDGTRDEERCYGFGRGLLIPVVVLVNNGTASASEIVTAALKDNGVAAVLGTKTFGKGLIQGFETLPDGSQLAITIERWLTPKGELIHGKGIEPNLVIPVNAVVDEAGGDSMLEAALEYLAGQRPPKPVADAGGDAN